MSYFTGKVVVVTGGSGGIGKALVELLYQAAESFFTSASPNPLKALVTYHFFVVHHFQSGRTKLGVIKNMKLRRSIH